MAARRLLILLLVLFGFSTLAAALIPVPPPAERTTSSTGETQTRSSTRIAERAIDADAQRASVIRLDEGDFLELKVRAERPTQIEIPRLGMVEDVGPYDPALLELAPPEAGTYAVRLATSGRMIATVEVDRATGCCRRG